ncbi:FtsB family cell division protein [Paenibacillus amylolyticus]|uniref:FtsB family cell division protein n=1 Tax=Paenibacillus amylolyticus TaxID=1451 RepID=UPI003EBE43EF
MSRTPVGRNKGPANQGKSAGARRRLMLWLTFVAVFAIWAGYTFLVQNAQISDKSSYLAAQQTSQQDTQKQLEQLKYEVSRLKDPEYIGQLARKKGYYLPEETPIQVEGSGN